MQCPVCKVTMKEQPYGPNKDVFLDTCSKCGGTWLDAGELNQLDECKWSNIETDSVFQTASDEEKSSITCPRCHNDVASLIPEDRPEIVVDRCTSCRGFWLDANEMMKWLVSRVLQ